MSRPATPQVRAEVAAGVELGAPLTEEAESRIHLVFHADGVRFEDDDLVFTVEGTPVRRMPRSSLAALEWHVERAVSAARTRHPNAGKPWTDEERVQLRAGIDSGLSWSELATQHGRSYTAVRMEAEKQTDSDSPGKSPPPF